MKREKKSLEDKNMMYVQQIMDLEEVKSLLLLLLLLLLNVTHVGAEENIIK